MYRGKSIVKEIMALITLGFMSIFFDHQCCPLYSRRDSPNAITRNTIDRSFFVRPENAVSSVSVLTIFSVGIYFLSVITNIFCIHILHKHDSATNHKQQPHVLRMPLWASKAGLCERVDK